MRRCDVGREPLSLRIGLRKNPADIYTVPCEKSDPQAECSVPNVLEYVEDLLIAVNMSLRYLPIFEPGISRFAGITNNHTAFELRGIYVQGLTLDTDRFEVNTGNAAILGGIIVLETGWNPDHLTLDISCDRDKAVRGKPVADKFVERADACDIECRRPGQAGTRRSF